MNLYIKLKYGALETAQAGDKGAYDVESYDLNMHGIVSVARLGRAHANLRDVDFFVATPIFDKAQGFDELVRRVSFLYDKGTAERGALLALCEYRRIKPYGLFDGLLDMARLNIFEFSIRKRLFFDITRTARSLGLELEYAK